MHFSITHFCIYIFLSYDEKILKILVKRFLRYFGIQGIQGIQGRDIFGYKNISNSDHRKLHDWVFHFHVI